MIKTLRLTGVFALLLPIFLKAQNLQPSKDECWKLFKQNATALGITTNDLSNWRIANFHYDQHANATYVYLQQTINGVDIENAINTVSFKTDKLSASNLTVLKELVTTNKTAAPSVDAASALSKAATALNLQTSGGIVALKKSAESNTQEFGKLGISYNNIPVKLLWTNGGNEKNNLKLAWEVMISSNINNALWRVLVDAQNGSIISKTNLTVYEQSSANIKKPHAIFVYEDDAAEQNVAGNSVQDIKNINSSKFNVIPYPFESFLYTNAALVTDPWTMNHNQDANTLKWNNDSTTDYLTTRGNNVYVQDDHDNSNNTFGYSPKSSTAVPNLTFNFAPSITTEPSDTANMKFNFTNLFYWSNLMHDLSYQYGFDEASGNFQQSNLARGGAGNDYVIADAQDGGGMNNANFATPKDGSNPRMQMYLFDPSRYKDFYVNQPLAFSGYHEAPKDVVSSNNSFVDVGAVTADVVLFKDSIGTTNTGCNTPSNKAELKNKIAYIDRGSCAFTVKFLNAQNAGAKAIIVGDNVVEPPFSMGGTDNSITIPGVMISLADATVIKGYLNTPVTVNTTLYGPQIDGEIDNTIPTHEYTHGISNRLVGGASVTCLQNNEQMGEGWSDYYALMITQNWPLSTLSGTHARTVGNYAIGEEISGGGIRYYPYATSLAVNPWTYDSLKSLPTGANFDPHTVGEIWCEMLWTMTWNIANTYGISNNIFDATQKGGNNIALSLVTQGMKLTKCSPGFVDARNGILQADTLLYNGKYSRQIWEAFASRGLGFSAKQGSSGSTKDGTPAYDLPTVLPVTFGNFTAQKQGSSALLRWTTASESNTDKFIAERSADGKQFNAIGEVAASGFSTTEKSYQLVDASPLKGNNIYHIKEVDKDGKINISELRSLNFDNINASIKISPNPATNIVTINVPGNNQNLNIRLLSSTGQSLKTYIMNGETLNINVSSLASGVYNFVIDGNGSTSKYKIVIQ